MEGTINKKNAVEILIQFLAKAQNDEITEEILRTLSQLLGSEENKLKLASKHHVDLILCLLSKNTENMTIGPLLLNCIGLISFNSFAQKVFQSSKAMDLLAYTLRLNVATDMTRFIAFAIRALIRDNEEAIKDFVESGTISLINESIKSSTDSATTRELLLCLILACESKLARDTFRAANGFEFTMQIIREKITASPATCKHLLFLLIVICGNDPIVCEEFSQSDGIELCLFIHQFAKDDKQLVKLASILLNNVCLLPGNAEKVGVAGLNVLLKALEDMINSNAEDTEVQLLSSVIAVCCSCDEQAKIFCGTGGLSIVLKAITSSSPRPSSVPSSPNPSSSNVNITNAEVCKEFSRDTLKSLWNILVNISCLEELCAMMLAMDGGEVIKIGLSSKEHVIAKGAVHVVSNMLRFDTSRKHFCTTAIADAVMACLKNHGGDIATVQSATALLQVLLQEEVCKDQLMENGVISTLCDVLDKIDSKGGTDAIIQVNVCLGVLILDSDVEMTDKRNIVNVLVKCCNKIGNSDKGFESIATLLQVLLVFKETCSAFVKCNGLEAMLTLCKKHVRSSRVLKSGCLALAASCFTEKAQEHFATIGGLVMVREALSLHKDNCEVVTSLLHLLCNTCCCNAGRVSLHGAGCMILIFDCLRCHIEDITFVDTCLHALVNASVHRDNLIAVDKFGKGILSKAQSKHLRDPNITKFSSQLMMMSLQL
eukprot:TRINITY_DN2995_c0_g1_i1.p1 TRINITY_DN2995_c0_g1~~TRINITY_DN2995_c0_g1_i1.p1  ORF type:complete len:714 (-),score=151.64 TRINITY_DN2995_c0_g1_i1:258-2399(-)